VIPEVALTGSPSTVTETVASGAVVMASKVRLPVYQEPVSAVRLGEIVSVPALPPSPVPEGSGRASK